MDRADYRLQNASKTRAKYVALEILCGPYYENLFHISNLWQFGTHFTTKTASCVATDIVVEISNENYIYLCVFQNFLN